MAQAAMDSIPKSIAHLLVEKEIVDEVPDQVNERRFFFVTDKVFEEVVARHRVNGVYCSQKEVDKINEALGSQLTVDDFYFAKHLNCKKCQKQITFYDIFKYGLDLHGIEFLRWAILSKVKKLHAFPKFCPQTFRCSERGHEMKKDESYCYTTKEYAYA